jgi:hypothetical protein
MPSPIPEYHLRCTPKRTLFRLKCILILIPSQSWVHPDHKVPALLNHEQLHFDITELYARKMKKEMSKYYFLSVSEFVSKKIDTEVKSIFTSLYNEHMSIQQKYDVETNTEYYLMNNSRGKKVSKSSSKNLVHILPAIQHRSVSKNNRTIISNERNY